MIAKLFLALPKASGTWSPGGIWCHTKDMDFFGGEVLPLINKFIHKTLGWAGDLRLSRKDVQIQLILFWWLFLILTEMLNVEEIRKISYNEWNCRISFYY